MREIIQWKYNERKWYNDVIMRANLSVGKTQGPTRRYAAQALLFTSSTPLSSLSLSLLSLLSASWFPTAHLWRTTRRRLPPYVVVADCGWSSDRWVVHISFSTLHLGLPTVFPPRRPSPHSSVLSSLFLECVVAFWFPPSPSNNIHQPTTTFISSRLPHSPLLFVDFHLSALCLYNSVDSFSPSANPPIPASACNHTLSSPHKNGKRRCF